MIPESALPASVESLSFQLQEMTEVELVQLDSIWLTRLNSLVILIDEIAIALLLSGCGYVIEGSNPVLPNEAQTLALLPIQNQTFKAGLETDLVEQLSRLLRSNSSVKMLTSGQADLRLKITLLKLKTSSSGLSKDQISTGVKAILQGEVILEDTRTGSKVWEEKMLQVKLSESGSNDSDTVSSISLSGSIRELIKQFAKKLYNRLFTTF